MIRKALLVGTTLGLATILSMGVSNAQDQQAPAPERKMERSNRNMDGNDCRNNQDCGSNADENRRERRTRSGDGDDNDGRRARSRDRDDDEDRVGRNNEDRRDARQRDRREARNWRYDPNHHRRSRHRDSTFRFYFGGYYYPERYWDGPTIVIGSNNRVSCGEGRDIVDDNGFNRVRTVECSGRNYTYTGRRQGDTFRIVLNSRTGRIVSVRAL